MDTAVLVMIILCIIYVPIWVWVWKRPEAAARFHLVKYGPTVMIKTSLGIKTMDKLGKYKRFWLVFGFISKLISAILFFLMMYMLITAVIALPSRIGQGGIGIQYALAIPGFNPMLPLTYGILALFIAMVVHEMGHGIQSRANDCKVDSTGLLYGVVPLGAFCEPNEKELGILSRRAQMDVYSAGISVNTIVAIISFVLLFLLCSAMTMADFGQEEDVSDLPGVFYIDQDSPAYDSGIPTSALIISIRGADEPETVEHMVEAIVDPKAVSFKTTDGYEISPLNYYYLNYVLSDGLTHTSETPIQLGALIKTITNNSPAKSAGLEPLSFLYSITITRDGTTMDEAFISSSYDFHIFMEEETKAGDIALVKTVTISDNGNPQIIEHEQVTLTSSGSHGFLGLSATDSGFTMTTPNAMLDKSVDPFYGASSPIEFVQAFFKYLSGPFNGLDPIPSSITWWYDAPMGDSTWVVVKTLYWLFWLDILLAISNALPAFPFDGGFLFEGGINWLLERLGIKDDERRKKLSESGSSAVSSVVLLMFFLVLLTFII